MSHSSMLNLTDWITFLLLVSFSLQVFTALLSTRIDLPAVARAQIEQLYANPYLHRIMNDPEYQELYLTVVFRHFREDFEQNLFGGWQSSHWPMVLQALNLLPDYYRVAKKEDKFKLRIFWHTWLPNLATEPIPHYRQTEVRVPQYMETVFKKDVVNYRSDTRTVRYDYLVEEMQLLVDSIFDPKSLRDFNVSSVKRPTFKAIYWLTVIDQFIGTVQQMRRKDGTAPPRSPFPRTQLVLSREPNQVPQQAGPRVDPVAVGQPSQTGQMASGPHQAGQRGGPMANPLAHHFLVHPLPRLLTFPLAPQLSNPLFHQAGPSGNIPERRAPSAAAGAPSSGTKRKATGQGGGPSQGGKKKGPGGAMRSMDGSLNEPQVGLRALKSNSRGSCTAMSWISLIMVTIAVSLISFS